MSRRLRTVAVWNMKVGRGRAAIRGLRALIRDTDADAVLLQEAKNYLLMIRLVFGVLWRIYGGMFPRTDSANCVVMVRRTIRRGRHGAVRNRTPWVYTGKGRRVTHPGRVWRWARADGVYLMSVHRSTNALSINKVAGREEADRVMEWFDDHAGPMLAAGDWNNAHDDPRSNAPADIAKHVKADVVVPGDSRIDFAIARDLDVATWRGSKYGSDHHAHIYRLRRP